MRALIALVLAIAGCNSGEPIEDRDGDGFEFADDCNDGDSSVFPGANEVCDGMDNDCNGVVDEGVATAFFADTDGDGYGDPLTVVLGCEAAMGLIEDGTDCDDQSGDVNPGATEICDDADNNCDGNIDEGVQLTLYVDRDGDGYGDQMLPLPGCETTVWLSSEGGDCDDTNPAIHPGMLEACDNSVDDDCDGLTDNDCPIEHCGTIDSDETWAAGPAHQVTCDVHVRGASSPILTINDGARVAFDSGTRLTVGSGGPGRLDVTGGTAGVSFSSSAAVPQPGDWGGVEFRAQDDGSVLERLLVRHAGGAGSLGALDVQQADVVLRACVIENSESHGLYVGTSASADVSQSTLSDNGKSGLFIAPFGALSTIDAPSFVGNTLSGNAEYPAHVRLADVAQLDATSSFAGNGADQVRVVGGSLNVDAVWQALDVPLYVDDDLNVGGATDPLVVWEDGLTVRMALGAGILIGFGSPGRLMVQGDQGRGVVVESERGVSGAPGDWQGIELRSAASGSVLDGLTVRHAGGNGNGGVLIARSAIEIHASTIEQNLEHGIHVISGGELALSDSNVSNNEEDGVHLDLNGRLSSTAGPTCVNNTVTGNGGVPISTVAEFVGQIDGSNTLSGNGLDRLEIQGGAVESFATWQLLDVALWITGDVTINSPAAPVVTVEPGVTLLFDPGTALDVALTGPGGLLAEGTSSERITLTSALDSPSAGDWEGVRFGSFCLDSDVRLDYVDVTYGGDNGFGNLFFASCDGSVSNATVSNSSSWGIYRQTASPTLSSITYGGNASGDVF